MLRITQKKRDIINFTYIFALIGVEYTVRVITDWPFSGHDVKEVKNFWQQKDFNSLSNKILPFEIKAYIDSDSKQKYKTS